MTCACQCHTPPPPEADAEKAWRDDVQAHPGPEYAEPFDYFVRGFSAGRRSRDGEYERGRKDGERAEYEAHSDCHRVMDKFRSQLAAARAEAERLRERLREVSGHIHEEHVKKYENESDRPEWWSLDFEECLYPSCDLSRLALAGRK